MVKPKRYGNICCVPGCCVNGNLSKIKFYRFSVRSYNFEKRAKWIKAVKRLNADGTSWEPSSRSRICSQHFVGGEKSEHPHSPAYLPTIFPKKNYGKQKNTETTQLQALNRFARAMRRSQNQNDLKVENTKLTNTKKKNEMQNNMDIIQLELQFNEVATQIDLYEDEVKQENIKKEIEDVDCLQDIETYDDFSKYYKQEYEGDLVIKEENVPEIKNEQVENENIITTYCNN